MNLRKRFALSCALVVLLGSTAAVASARTLLKGTFDLPEETYWGNARLPAGAYTLAVKQDVTGTRLITLQGDGVSATLLVPSGVGEATSGRNYLKLETVNGAYVVRELDSSMLGGSFRFPVSKAVRNRAEGGSPAASLTVPVSTGGN